MDAALLELNEVLKQKNAKELRHAAAHLAQHGQFAISSITRYELLRGLKEKNASSQLARFQAFCQQTTIFAVVNDILDRAVDLWVAGRTQTCSAFARN